MSPKSGSKFSVEEVESLSPLVFTFFVIVGSSNKSALRLMLPAALWKLSLFLSLDLVVLSLSSDLQTEKSVKRGTFFYFMHFLLFVKY